MTPGSRRGVRQALETRLRLPVTDERIEFARIPVIDYLRKYRHVCGVSPVAGLAGEEFRALYGLTAAVPSTAGSPRGAPPDRLFDTAADRDRAVTEQAKKLTAEGHQVLIGTPTHEDSIRVSELLSHHGIPRRAIGASSAAGSLPDPVPRSGRA
jgi:preprotein translocase subunit SecA